MVDTVSKLINCIFCVLNLAAPAHPGDEFVRYTRVYARTQISTQSRQGQTHCGQKRRRAFHIRWPRPYQGQPCGHIPPAI